MVTFGLGNLAVDGVEEEEEVNVDGVERNLEEEEEFILDFRMFLEWKM